MGARTVKERVLVAWTVIALGFALGAGWLPLDPRRLLAPASSSTTPLAQAALAEFETTATSSAPIAQPPRADPPAVAVAVRRVTSTPMPAVLDSARPSIPGAGLTVAVHTPSAATSPSPPRTPPSAGTPLDSSAPGPQAPTHAAGTPMAEPVDVPPEVSRVKTSRPVVALTFDAGGEAGSTAQTLRILRERGVRATFFVTGQFADTYPALVREMVLDSHEIANHTYHHRDLEHLSNGEIVGELERTDAILRGFTGVSTRPLMRAPFGSRDGRVRAAIASAGYRSIYWAIDGGDWKPGATPFGVATAVKRAVAGDVVVQHCATAQTAAALPTILDDLSRRGLSIVTVSALLAG